MGGLAHRRRSAEETSSEAIESGFMSAKEAAAFLGIPLRSLYLYVQQGLLPSFRLGRHRLFRRHELLRALHATKTASRDEILR
jgi:excisionase family DNA binding protein